MTGTFSWCSRSVTKSLVKRRPVNPFPFSLSLPLFLLPFSFFLFFLFLPAFSSSVLLPSSLWQFFFFLSILLHSFFSPPSFPIAFSFSNFLPNSFLPLFFVVLIKIPRVWLVVVGFQLVVVGVHCPVGTKAQGEVHVHSVVHRKYTAYMYLSSIDACQTMYVCHQQ
ncbi:hypothetical protein HDV63DRAFT_362833 [Trichoderma sp. SZMC 28014]